MKSDTEKWQTKRDRGLRFQAVIDDHYDTLYAFQKACTAKGYDGVADAVEKWVPPQGRYRAAKNGAAVRREDWQAIRMPEGGSLVAFCEITGATADHLLIGSLPRYRDRSRDQRTLAEDVAAHVRAQLQVREALGELSLGPAARRGALPQWQVDGGALLQDIVEREAQRISAWSEWFYRVGAVEEGAYVVLAALRAVAAILPSDAPADQAFGLLAELGLRLGEIFEKLPKPEQPIAMPDALTGRHLHARIARPSELVDELVARLADAAGRPAGPQQ